MRKFLYNEFTQRNIVVLVCTEKFGAIAILTTVKPLGANISLNKWTKSQNIWCQMISSFRKCPWMWELDLILTLYFYTSYLWKQTIYISAVCVAALSRELDLNVQRYDTKTDCNLNCKKSHNKSEVFFKVFQGERLVCGHTARVLCILRTWGDGPWAVHDFPICSKYIGVMALLVKGYK